MKQVVHRLTSNIDRVDWPSGHGALVTNPPCLLNLLPSHWVPVLAYCLLETIRFKDAEDYEYEI